jgi:hypothetical protein
VICVASCGRRGERVGRVLRRHQFRDAIFD